MSTLSKFATEAKTFWTQRRPLEAATMTDEDFEQIAANIRAAIAQMETPTLQSAATMGDQLQERIAMVNQTRASAEELARHEFIYSMPTEPQVLATEQQEERPEIDLAQLDLLENRLSAAEQEPDPDPMQIAAAREELAQFKADWSSYFETHPEM